MISNSDLLINILRLALTTAALIMPTISMAYFLVTKSEDEKERMSKVIGFGSIAAIILVLCSIITFVFLCLGWENEQWTVYISGGMFMIGCFLLLYILLVLAGIKIMRELPLFSEKSKKSAARVRHPN